MAANEAEKENKHRKAEEKHFLEPDNSADGSVSSSNGWSASDHRPKAHAVHGPEPQDFYGRHPNQTNKHAKYAQTEVGDDFLAQINREIVEAEELEKSFLK